MGKYDFVKDTVKAGGLDFTTMTAEQLADKLMEGVPEKKLKELASKVAGDAAAQAQLNKYTAVVLELALKQLNANGAVGIQNLLAVFA